jgi:DNA-binding CsgD family transcriptional regulator
VPLDKIEELARYLMNPGLGGTEVCKFLALHTFSSMSPTGVYVGKITDNGFIAPVAVYGEAAIMVASWGAFAIEDDFPLSEAVKRDEILLTTRRETLDRWSSVADREVIPTNASDVLVFPIVPFGVISMPINSRPVIDESFRLFVKTAGLMVHNYFCQRSEQNSSTKSKFKTPKDLTERQKTILSLMKKGLSNPEIADQIAFSESLVRQETMAIYSTLKIAGRRELLENSGEG